MEAESNTDSIHKYCENHQFLVELLGNAVNDIQQKLNCFENRAITLFNHPSVGLNYEPHLQNIQSGHLNFQFKIYEEQQHSSCLTSNTSFLNPDRVAETTQPVYCDTYTSPVLTCVTGLTDKIMTMDRLVSSCVDLSSVISKKLTRVKIFQLQPDKVKFVQLKVDKSSQHRNGLNQSVPVQYYSVWNWHITKNPTVSCHNQQYPSVVQIYPQQIDLTQYRFNTFLHNGNTIQSEQSLQMGNHSYLSHSLNVSSQQDHQINLLTDINSYTQQRNPPPAASGVYESLFSTNNSWPEFQQPAMHVSSELINEMLMSTVENLNGKQNVTSPICTCCNSCILDMHVFCGCVVEKFKCLQIKTDIVYQDLEQIKGFEKARQLPQFDINSIQELQIMINGVISLQHQCLGLCSDVMFYSTMSENNFCNSLSSPQNGTSSCKLEAEKMSPVMIEQSHSTTVSNSVSQTLVSARNSLAQETEGPLDLTKAKADSTKNHSGTTKCNVIMDDAFTQTNSEDILTPTELDDKPPTASGKCFDQSTVYCVKENGSVLHKAKNWFKKRDKSKSKTSKINQEKKCKNVSESSSETSMMCQKENVKRVVVLSGVASKVETNNRNSGVVLNNVLKKPKQSKNPTSQSSKFSTSTPNVSVNKGNSKWRESYNCSTGQSKNSAKVKNIQNCTMSDEKSYKTSHFKSWVDLSPIKTVVREYNESSVKSESDSLFSWNLEESLFDMSRKKIHASNTGRKNKKNEGQIMAERTRKTILGVNRSTSKRGNKNAIYSKIVLPRKYDTMKSNCTIDDLRNEEFKTRNHDLVYKTVSDVHDSDIVFTKSKRKLCFEDEYVRFVRNNDVADIEEKPLQREKNQKKLKL